MRDAASDHSAHTAYLQAHFVHEPPYFAGVRAAGERLRPGIQLSALEGRMLAFFVGLRGAGRVLEIGTFAGYSSLWMASALPPGGSITTLERDNASAQLARAHCAGHEVGAPITILEGDALELLRAMPQAPSFDFVFIDAEKRAYPDYLDAVEPLLVADAWIVADNTALFGSVFAETYPGGCGASHEAWEAMRRFNARLGDARHYDTLWLDTPEGMILAKKKPL